MQASIAIIFSSIFLLQTHKKLEVEKCWIFSSTHHKGKIMMDNNRKPLEKGYWQENSIVLQVKNNNSTTFTHLKFNNKLYPISAIKIDNNDYKVGKLLNTDSTVTLAKQTQSSFYKIGFKNIDITDSTCKFVIIGKCNNKSVSYTTKCKITTLEGQQYL
jgi:hypothetical protein